MRRLAVFSLVPSSCTASPTTVPFADTVELLLNSGLDESALIVVGNDHRLADRVPLAVMLMAVEESVERPAVRKTVITKGQCKDCSHYHCCPRMRGENMCYSLKEEAEQASV